MSLQDRDNQVRVLLQQVKHLQADKVVLEPLSRPPGSACRTVSVAVQTCTHHHMPEDASEAPIIPLQSPCFSVDVSGGSDVGPANMMSLSAADAVSTYIHTCIHTHMHIYIHIYIHTCMYAWHSNLGTNYDSKTVPIYVDVPIYLPPI